MKRKTTVLVVGVPAAALEDFRERLEKQLATPVRALSAESLAAAMVHVKEESIECVLLSRAVPDFEVARLESLSRVSGRRIPVVLVDERAAEPLSPEPPDDVWGVVYLEGHRFESPSDVLTVRRAIELLRAKERLRALETEISSLKSLDTVSELPGRELFRRKLEESIARSGGKSMTGAMLIGLDGFKAINRSFGHELGDALLRMVAVRLRHCVRNADMLARWGGDEFSAVLEQLTRPEDAVFVAQRVIYALSRPFSHEGQELFVTPSIGIAIHPAHGEDAATLLQHADRAMYRTKRTGGNNYQLYSAQMDANVAEQLATEGRLRTALKRNEFALQYQPQLDVRDGRIVGLEALLRWNDPVAGLRSPLEFIPILEQTGLIVPVGEWVLRKACTQARAWQFAGLSDLRVAVNLSPKQFRESTLVDRVESILDETGLAPECLELELTESVLMEDRSYAGAIMSKLKDMGVMIALDDFGTGYSALSVLKEFPVNTLKIDRAFIRDIASREDDRSICSAIVRLGQDLRLHVLAEGVENEVQVQILKSQGCHLVQGFFYARPMPADDVWEWLIGRKEDESLDHLAGAS